MFSTTPCILHVSKFHKKAIVPARSPDNEEKILDNFYNGYGPNAEDVMMFKQALIRLKEEELELVNDFHWANYVSDTVLHKNIVITY